MDEREYLEQISEASRKSATPSKLSKLMSSKIFMVGMIGLVLLIIIIVIGAILGGAEKEPTRAYRLKLHIDATNSVISEYQPYVRSSTLRSSSASLSGVLANTSKDLGGYLADKYVVKDGDQTDARLVEAATLDRDALINDLFEAKINGILDRIYAHKMAYEISIIATEEANIINSTKSADLQNLLLNSYNSLNNLYDHFNNFSETK